MKLKMSWLLALGLFLLTVSLGVANQAPIRPGPYLHPKLKANEVKIRAVVVLPAIVTMSKQGVKGTEGMANEEDTATGDLASHVSAGLTTSGLSVQSPFTDAALKDNNELKYALADVQKKFDEIAPQLSRKPKDVRKGRFTMGDMVAVLNSKGNADALVFIRSNGVKLTKGKGMMTGGLIGLAASGKPTFTTTVAVVDAKSGDVLFLDGFITSGLPKDKAFDKSFKKITSPK